MCIVVFIKPGIDMNQPLGNIFCQHLNIREMFGDVRSKILFPLRMVEEISLIRCT